MNYMKKHEVPEILGFKVALRFNSTDYFSSHHFQTRHGLKFHPMEPGSSVQGPPRDQASTDVDEAIPEISQQMVPLNWPEYFLNFLQQESKDPLGSFAATKRLSDVPFLFPMLSVKEVGSIPLPLVDAISEQLKSVARKAPFGVGSETILDDRVRKCWEIDASQVTVMQSAELKEYFAKIVQESCYQLGISKASFEKREIRANLYKILLYEEGGHFLPHRDSEKEDGMFGTLILQLPSEFSGGGLTVNHDGKTKYFYHDEDSASSVHATAFYADCEHEVNLIWSGRRLCLAYNLVADSIETCPSYSVSSNVEAELFRMANYWRRHRAERKLGYPLKHFYTQKSFSFSSMKREDAHVLTTLTNANCPRERPIFDVWLVLMERHVSRDADGGDDAEEEISVLKLLDSGGAEIKVEHKDEPYWKMIRRQDGWMVCEADFEDYLEENEIKESEEDEYENNCDFVRFNLHSLAFKFGATQHIEGAEFIGNEGVAEEFWYHAGAIVISPK
jgi:2OG-Fe(II) oxygenase superfamily